MKNWIIFSVILLYFCSPQTTYAQTCANSGTRASDDFDCDGIINSQDKDADNDGILDVDEKCSNSYVFHDDILPIYVVNMEGNVEYQSSNLEIKVNQKESEAPGGSFVIGPYDKGPNHTVLTPYIYKIGGSERGWKIAGIIEIFDADDIYASVYWEHDYEDNYLLGSEKTFKIPFVPKGEFYIRFTDLSTSIPGEANSDNWNLAYFKFHTFCNQDIDEDGHLNWFDSDSDGDGCFDIFESGVTDDQSVEFVEDLPSFTSVGSNGFADNLEFEADSGVSKNPFDVLYKMKDSSKCANFDPDWAIGTGNYDDFDKDGIRNGLDLDADNDGILNIDEETCKEETYVHIYDDYFWRQQINLSGTHTNPSNPQEFLRTNIPAAATGFYCNPNNPNDGRSNGGTTYGKTYVRTLNDQPGVYYVTRRYVVVPNQKVTISYSYKPIRGRNFRQIVSGLSINNQRVDRFYSYSTPIVTRTVEITPTTQFLDIVMDFSSPGSCFADEAEISIHSVSQELPKEVCEGNYDGDEYDNRYDLDSDNDGCYDFAESGLVNSGNDSLASTDIRFTTIGINGFADYAETEADNATPVYPETNFFLDSLFGNCQTCTDSIAPVLTGVPDDINISCYKILSFDVSATDEESDNLALVKDSTIYKTGEKVDSIQYKWSVVDDCENKTIDSVMVRYVEPSPINFKVIETSFCNQTIQIDSLEGFEKYQTFAWTLAEGEGSLTNANTQIPSLTFNSPGDFKLELVATDSLGCSTSKVVPFWVAQDKSAFEITGNNEYCEGDTLKLQVNTNGEKVTWKTPLGATSIGKTISIEEIKLGFAGKYQAIIESSTICTDTLYMDVKVNRRGSIRALGNDVICLGSNLDLEMNASEGATYTWTWNDSIVSTDYFLDINSSVFGIGVHDLILTKVPLVGCPLTGINKIEVIENNVFSFPNDTIALLNGKIEVDPMGFGTGIWTGPDGFTSFSPNFTISKAAEANQGTYHFRGLTNKNCVIEDSFTVAVINLEDYIPFFKPLNCEGTEVQLSLNKLENLFKWKKGIWESEEGEPIVTVEPGEVNKFTAIIAIDSLVFELPLNVTTTNLLNIEDSISQPTDSSLGEITIELDSSLSYKWLDDESATLNRSDLEAGLYELLVSNEYCTDTVQYELMRADVDDDSGDDDSGDDDSGDDDSGDDDSGDDDSGDDDSGDDDSGDDDSDDDDSDDDDSDDDDSDDDDSGGDDSGGDDSGGDDSDGDDSDGDDSDGDDSDGDDSDGDDSGGDDSGGDDSGDDDSGDDDSGDDDSGDDDSGDDDSGGDDSGDDDSGDDDSGGDDSGDDDSDDDDSDDDDSDDDDSDDDSDGDDSDGDDSDGDDSDDDDSDDDDSDDDDSGDDDSDDDDSDDDDSDDDDSDDDDSDDDDSGDDDSGDDDSDDDDSGDDDSDDDDSGGDDSDDDDSGGDDSGDDDSGGDDSNDDDSGGDDSGGDDSGGDDSGGDDSGDDDSDGDDSDDDDSDDDDSDDDDSDDDDSDDDDSDDDDSDDDDSDDGDSDDGDSDDGDSDDGDSDDGDSDDGDSDDGDSDDGDSDDGDSNDDDLGDDDSDDENSDGDDSDGDDSDDGDSNDEVFVYLNKDNQGDFCFDTDIADSYFTKVCENEVVREISLSGNCLKLEAAVESPEAVCYAICKSGVCDTINILVVPYQEEMVLNDDYIKLNSSDRIILNPIVNDLNLDTTVFIRIKTEPQFGNVRIEGKGFVYEPEVNKCGVIDSFVYEVERGGEQKEAVVFLEFPCYNIEIKNGISPNGDGLNEGLYIENIDQYEDTELVIFNRFGNKVFKQKNYQNDDPWKGTFKERFLPEGIYFYVFKVKKPTQKTFSGNLIISY